MGFLYHIGTPMFDCTHTEVSSHVVLCEWCCLNGPGMALTCLESGFTFQSFGVQLPGIAGGHETAMKHAIFVEQLLNSPVLFLMGEKQNFCMIFGIFFSSQCETFPLAISPVPLFRGDHRFWMFVAAFG